MLRTCLKGNDFFDTQEQMARFERDLLLADADAQKGYDDNGKRNAKIVREIIGMVLHRRILNMGTHGVMLVCDERNNPPSQIDIDQVVVDVMVNTPKKTLQLRFEYGGTHVSN